ncbi:SHOCT domain-containing protein [Terrabacter carboxydivorans]|uniref:SHOCT domain-containing protein n=1 Tax=Terrabacter carboxydivorans TaxID=619730 RepID=A0ABP5YH78_9MICO
MRGRMGRPGLLGLAARTAVVAGTANAVSGKMQQGQQVKAQQAADAEAYRQQQEAAAQAAATQAAVAQALAAQAPPPPPPPPPAPAPAAAPAAMGADDMIAALERLAALHAQGILTDEELAQQKARILAG